ncbi:MAG: mevalonate kinase [Clostridia bacterium]|jgi:galactokinase/mevalonate kinase-like predicted kinase
MMIKVTAPGRAGIIGNPTDGYGGSLISCSIKNRAEVTIQSDKGLILESENRRKELIWRNDYENKQDEFDIIRCVLRFLRLYNLKARITFKSNIPVQAGLAGSTALLSCVLSAVLAYTGIKKNKYELAEMNRTIELNYLKCQCGYQDAYMTTFGGLCYLDFRGKEYYKDYLEEIYAVVENISSYVKDLPFVIVHTGIKHNSGDFHKPLRERWLDGDEAVIKGYKEIACIAREGKKALIKQNWEELAYLMNQNHKIQSSLAFSGEQNEYMIKIAKENGALAAKLAGAGGGGTIIALTLEPERTKKALIKAGAEKLLELDPKAKGVTVEIIKKTDQIAI